MKKILLIDAGGLSIERFNEIIKTSGELNHTLTQFAKDYFIDHHWEVKETYIKDGYDVAKEIEKFLWADVIVYQTPIWWMSVPWGLKKYMDDVYVQNFFYKNDGRTSQDSDHNYGTGGLLNNKHFYISATFNAPKHAFTAENDFFRHDPELKKLFFWFELAQEFLGIKPLKHFMVNNVIKNPDIKKYLNEYKEHLDMIVLKLL